MSGWLEFKVNGGDAHKVHIPPEHLSVPGDGWSTNQVFDLATDRHTPNKHPLPLFPPFSDGAIQYNASFSFPHWHYFLFPLNPIFPIVCYATLVNSSVGDVANDDDDEDEEADGDALADVKLFRADLGEFPLTVPDFIF